MEQMRVQRDWPEEITPVLLMEVLFSQEPIKCKVKRERNHLNSILNDLTFHFVRVNDLIHLFLFFWSFSHSSEFKKTKVSLCDHILYFIHIFV